MPKTKTNMKAQVTWHWGNHGGHSLSGDVLETSCWPHPFPLLPEPTARPYVSASLVIRPSKLTWALANGMRTNTRHHFPHTILQAFALQQLHAEELSDLSSHALKMAEPQDWKKQGYWNPTGQATHRQAPGLWQMLVYPNSYRGGMGKSILCWISPLCGFCIPSP